MNSLVQVDKSASVNLMFVMDIETAWMALMNKTAVCPLINESEV